MFYACREPFRTNLDKGAGLTKKPTFPAFASGKRPSFSKTP
jgi:hypothetical protein